MRERTETCLRQSPRHCSSRSRRISGRCRRWVQKPTLQSDRRMSALPLEADIYSRDGHVRLGLRGDMPTGLRQFVEHGFCGSEVGGFEALSEPAKSWSEQRAGVT